MQTSSGFAPEVIVVTEAGSPSRSPAEHSYQRSRPSRDELGPGFLPRVFHLRAGDESDLRRRYELDHLQSREITRVGETKRTVCPTHSVPPGSGPGIVSGRHPENFRRGRRKRNLKWVNVELIRHDKWTRTRSSSPCFSAATLIPPTLLLSGRINSSR